MSISRRGFLTAEHPPTANKDGHLWALSRCGGVWLVEHISHVKADPAFYPEWLPLKSETDYTRPDAIA